ncbi:unnamed protein product, partial [Vitis vinifera]|uniref:Uncharacterized protein n=1 Tax=Vitis vinifera TaxID=29760 RepID=D7UDX7_VITVI
MVCILNNTSCLSFHIHGFEVVNMLSKSKAAILDVVPNNKGHSQPRYIRSLRRI